MRLATPAEKLAHDLNEEAAECFPLGGGPTATVYRDAEGREMVAVNVATCPVEVPVTFKRVEPQNEP